MVQPDEYATILTEAGQERAAQGIADGVKNFLAQGLSATKADSRPPLQSRRRSVKRKRTCEPPRRTPRKRRGISSD